MGRTAQLESGGTTQASTRKNRRNPNLQGGIEMRRDESGKVVAWRAWVPKPENTALRKKGAWKNTRKAAEAQRAELMVQVKQGLPLTDDRRTVETYMMEWLGWRKQEGRLRASTLRRDEEILRLYVLPAVGAKALTKLAPMDLQRLYSRMLAAGKAPATVRRVHALFSKALSQAERLDLVTRNAARRVDAPRPEPKIEYQIWTEDEARRFNEAIVGDPLEALWRVFLVTGARRGEVLALKWEDIEWETGFLTISRKVRMVHGGYVLEEPKTRAGHRRLPLTPACLESLKQWKAKQAAMRLAAGPAWHDADLIFTDQRGRPMNPNHVLQRMFYPLLERLGLRQVRLHDLRHFYVSFLIATGVDIKTAQVHAGHARSETTLDRYAHKMTISDTKAREALIGLFG